MVVTKGAPIVIPTWATYIAMQPDGWVYVFEHKPEIIELPGVYRSEDGYVFGPPVPYWQSEGWQQAIRMPTDHTWRYGEDDPADLFGNEWPGWRESLSSLIEAPELEW